MVADPETLKPVPKDGSTMGEIFFRGNDTMKGYLKNPGATDEAFLVVGSILVISVFGMKTAMLS